MSSTIVISNLNKVYPDGHQALKNINLEIQQGEIFALLGPNGAGKTTLINTICGVSNATDGTITVEGHDVVKDYRVSRSFIGLVPQELHTDAFETVWNTVKFSRGLFGKPSNPAYLEQLLNDLSLWDKKNNQIRTLSGGMKRRVMIAKALSHEPRILFLDEPTAGVDIELRKDMWNQVRGLKNSGVTIILTTHYIEEAEEMADRVGVINRGQLILVEDKVRLMSKLGRKQIMLTLATPQFRMPDSFSQFDVQLKGAQLTYTYDPTNNSSGVSNFFDHLKTEKIEYTDILTQQNSLEEIFVELVKKS